MISERLPSSAWTDDPQLLEDLFHALSQPLTTLRCCLGLALQKSADPQPQRGELEVALQAAESVSRLIGSIRELAGGGQCHPSATANLSQCLRQAVDDFRPVAESAGVTLSLECHAAIDAAMERNELCRALFHLLEFACGCCQARSKLNIAAAESGDVAVIMVHAIHASSTIDVAPLPLERRVMLAVARRIFQAAGGHLQCQVHPGGFLLQIEIPRTAAESQSRNLRVS